MAIDKKDVEYIANLARLNLSEEEKSSYGDQLNSILEYMEKLNELDTESVQPTAHVVPIQEALREDKERPSIPQDVLLRNGPETQDGFFTIPKVIS